MNNGGTAACLPVKRCIRLNVGETSYESDSTLWQAPACRAQFVRFHHLSAASSDLQTGQASVCWLAFAVASRRPRQAAQVWDYHHPSAPGADGF